MKLQGFLLMLFILCILLTCYLGKKFKEGLRDKKDKKTKYSKQTDRQKGVHKIMDDVGKKKSVIRPRRQSPTKQDNNGIDGHRHGSENYHCTKYGNCKYCEQDGYSCHCKHGKHKEHCNNCDKEFSEIDKKYFNRNNYMLKTKMVPLVCPKGPYFKIMNDGVDGEGVDGVDGEGVDGVDGEDSCDDCDDYDNCLDSSGNRCDKKNKNSFFEMNTIPPPTSHMQPNTYPKPLLRPSQTPLGSPPSYVPMLNDFSKF